MTAEDFAEIVHSVNSYLVETGLPPSPFTWWEVAPPDGMRGGEFMRRLEDAATERVTATSGAEVAHQYAAILTDEIDTIFGRGEARD